MPAAQRLPTEHENEAVWRSTWNAALLETAALDVLLSMSASSAGVPVDLTFDTAAFTDLSADESASRIGALPKTPAR